MAKAAASAAAGAGSSDTVKRPKGLRAQFQRLVGRSVATRKEKAQDPSSHSVHSAPALAQSTVFWPEEYLAVDIPQARVWTYGYNANVIEGFFKANSRNSISDHGRDLSEKLPRGIVNKVY